VRQHSSKPWRCRQFDIFRKGPGRTEFKLDGYRALILKDPASLRIQRWPSAKQSLASDG
jgi:hypothetical protein